MEIQNGADGTLKNKHARFSGLGAAVAGVALALLLVAGAAGCGPGKPAVDTYLASVTNASAEQNAADRQRIAQQFAEVAAQHGLVLEQHLPSDTVALYFPGPTGLNLSLSARNMNANTISLSAIPVNLGRRDNAGCRSVIATLDKSFKQAFGARMQTSP